MHFIAVPLPHPGLDPVAGFSPAAVDVYLAAGDERARRAMRGRGGQGNENVSAADTKAELDTGPLHSQIRPDSTQGHGTYITAVRLT